MSEMTREQEQLAADRSLDAQIDAWYEAHHQPVNLPPNDWTPERDAPPILVEVEDETHR